MAKRRKTIMYLEKADAAALEAAAKNPALTQDQQSRLKTIQRLAIDAWGKRKAPTVVIEMSGGVIHSVKSNEDEIMRANFIVTGEEDDCDPERIVHLRDSDRCILTLAKAEFLPLLLKQRAEIAAEKYRKAARTSPNEAPADEQIPSTAVPRSKSC